MNSFSKPNLEIADIFKEYGHLLGKIPKAQHKVIQDILNCRTSALGGHSLKCNSCDYTKQSYNSCRNRHCSKCQFLSQVKWVEKRSDELLPCPYFHIVFTLPDKLRPLILRNKKNSYNILFKSSSLALKKIASDPKRLGVEIGCIGVLHTWSQNLLDHPHVHFIVPSGGLYQNKTKWKQGNQDYFLPVKALSKAFKGIFLELLEKSFFRDGWNFSEGLEYLGHYPNFKEFLMS